MNKFIYIFLISVFVISCTSNTIIQKPDNLIPKDQMVDLLSDMLIANSGQHFKNLNLKRKVNYYPLVFEKYNIDSTQFRVSNYYYTSNFDEYNDILKRVKVKLSTLKEKYNIDLEKNEDSIEKAEGEAIKKPTKLKRNRNIIERDTIIPQVF